MPALQYSRFDRSSSEGEESDAEERSRGPKAERRRSQQQPVDPEAGLDDDEKAQLLVLKVKWMLVELLREVTDDEFRDIALEVVGRRRRPAPPAQTSAAPAPKVHRMAVPAAEPTARPPIGGMHMLAP
jgi:hypothetical protein